jgi:hypothetical protein
VDHQTLATRIHRLIEKDHPAPPPVKVEVTAPAAATAATPPAAQ